MKKEYIAFSLIPEQSLSLVQKNRLFIEFGGNLDALFTEPQERLEEMLRATGAYRKKKRLHFDSNDLLGKAKSLLDGFKGAILTPDDGRFPFTRELSSPMLTSFVPSSLPPFILWCRGKVELLGSSLLGIVGTRHPRALSVGFAMHVAKRSGVPTVSGFARGIDAAAHAASLEAGFGTVAVLGNGIDVLYPAEHAGLYRRIIAGGGCIVTEHPPGIVPTWGHFPFRNRIIALLSSEILLVQASHPSGALHTAHYAKAYGKPLYLFYPVHLNGFEGNRELAQRGEGRRLFPAGKDGFFRCDGDLSVFGDEKLSVIPTRHISNGLHYNRSGGDCKHDETALSIIEAIERIVLEQGEISMDGILSALPRYPTEAVVSATMNLRLSEKIFLAGGAKFYPNYEMCDIEVLRG